MSSDEGIVYSQDIFGIPCAERFLVNNSCTFVYDLCKLFFIGNGNNCLNSSVALCFLEVKDKAIYCMDAYNHTFAFSDYSLNQAMELVDKYKPDVLWNDIGWPEKGQGDLPYLFSHYYNTVPQGAINDRWYCSFNDFTTAEYLRGKKTFEKKWEMCRGLGLSFGYNQNENPENILSGTELVRLLIQYVSHNGNLLINIGPRADGTIPELQATRLLELGAWLEKHGEAIYGTRPWPEHPQEQLLDGITAYYTRKGNDLFVVFDGCTPGLHTLRIDCYPQEITVEAPDEYPVHYRLPHYFN